MGLLTYSPGRTRVKICGLRTAADIDAVVAAGADAVGFVFYPPSVRAVSPNIAAQLISRLPAGIDAVGLVVNATDEQFAAIKASAPITLWQFHGDETPERCIELADGQPWMKAGRIGEGFAFDEFSLQYGDANALLLDALVEGYGGGGVPFDWQGIPQTWVSENAPRVVLSGGLNTHNVGEAIARLHPCAVDVSSGVESSRGVKDPALIAQFVKAVRAADEKSSSQ
ncbi:MULTISPECIES: phosphoribosylanthranilate isomerase [unclassified Polynucleobacter]|jgi:phosphoribosylanthranilate isomerase|uniref:phosphoribosylanthranilate isomerase n=1 Tax=unclassified Polynucleobacter TaxID=2640945 RepID=UPI001BFE6A91|nr:MULTISPECIES: phosphoribosylanthranilate isomerase [unclassified Polynucleobacter]MBU3606520.1 phosphoribosylanthranilate isomerase [Polynucleobacter sp. MWH-Creno-3A4]QWD78661.1 phosphoribosylanthranilate isomerase [Polynucleobacter sp. MWH-Svant-W18]